MGPDSLRALLLASLAHAAFYGVLRDVSSRNPLLDRAPPAPMALTWIDLADGEGPPRPVDAAPQSEPRDARPDDAPRATRDATLRTTEGESRPTMVVAPGTRGAPAPPESAGGSLEPHPAEPAPPTTDGGEGWTAEPDGLWGLDSWRTGGLPSGLFGGAPGGPGVAATVAMEGAEGTAAPTEAPKAAVIDGSGAAQAMSRTLLGQDRAVGIDLPATQRVVAAVAEMTRTVGAPHNTKATFVVSLGPGGQVGAVSVNSSSGGDQAAWTSAARKVKGRLGATPLDLGPARETGATIAVSVTVKHVFPTGSSKGAEITPVCANQLINDLAEAASSDRPTPDGELPDIPLLVDEKGRPCIPIGVKGNADMANIGATKQIIIQTTSKVMIAGREALPTELVAVDRSAPWVDGNPTAPKPVAPHRVRKIKKDREKKR